MKVFLTRLDSSLLLTIVAENEIEAIALKTWSDGYSMDETSKNKILFDLTVTDSPFSP